MRQTSLFSTLIAYYEAPSQAMLRTGYGSVWWILYRSNHTFFCCGYACGTAPAPKATRSVKPCAGRGPHAPSPSLNSRSLADLGDDRSGSRMAGVRLVSGVGANHDNVDDIAGDRRPRLGDLASNNHPHQRRHGRWRVGAVAGVRRPGLAAGWCRVAVLEALEACRRRAATHGVGFPPLRTPPQHGGPGMVLEIADDKRSPLRKHEGPRHCDSVRLDRAGGIGHRRLQLVRSWLSARVRERGLAAAVGDS